MEMGKQTRQAVAEADVVVFVVDAREGMSAQDHDIANYLRRLGKTCVLVANKAEGMKEAHPGAEFFELGTGRGARGLGRAWAGHQVIAGRGHWRLLPEPQEDDASAG
jgi:GTP-binding protein